MRATEKKHHDIYMDLIAVSKKYPAQTLRIPAFGRLIQKLEQDIEPVLTVDSQAQKSTKGVTIDKNNLQSTLKIAVGRLCQVMIGHATEAQNVVLETSLTELKSKFAKARASDFANVCTEVVEEARKLEAHWADCGITEGNLATIETQIAEFKTKQPIGKEIKTETKKAVKKRASFFENAVSRKKQILNVAAAYMGVDDEFYAEILVSLRVGKRGPGVSQIKVIIKSAETQKPIMNQPVRVMGSDLAETSDKKGVARIKFPKGGLFSLEIPLPNGEIKIQKDVEVKRNKTTSVIVLL